MKIYVGNLPFKAEEDAIREVFEQYGAITSLAMINDRETGRFRGFCFIEMEDSDALKAIEGLNDENFEGRPLCVNEARPQVRNNDRRGGYSGGGGGYSGGGGGGYSGGGGGGGYGRDRDRGRGRDRNRDRY